MNSTIQNRNTELNNIIEAQNKQILELQKKLGFDHANNSNIKTELFEKDYAEFKNSDMFEFFHEIGSYLSQYQKFPGNIDPIVREKYLFIGIVERVDDELYRFSEKGKYFWHNYIMKLQIRKRRDNTDDLPF